MTLPRVERDISGSYQLDALLRGRALQRAWHRARLELVGRLLPPRPDAPSLDLAAGAGILVAGNAVFGSADPERAIRDLRAAAGAAVAR